MYTICNNLNHEECVYNLIKRPQPCCEGKPPMHVSRYACMVRKQVQCHKKGCNRTMGPPVIPLCPPEKFLRKHSRAPISIRPPAVPRVKVFPVAVETAEDTKGAEVEINVTHEGKVQDDPCQILNEMDNMDKKPDEKGDGCAEKSQEPPPKPQNPEIEIQIGGPCPDDPQPPPPQPPVMGKRRIPRMCCEMEKPAVPTVYASRFGIIARGCRDFVKENALKVIRQPAKIPAANIVDQPKGTIFNWPNSGWARKYVFRKDYGQVPGYLVQRKQELEEKCRKERYASEQAERDARDKCRHLEEQERQGLICGLKTNWQQTYQEFQSLPLLIDTAAKVKLKQELEEKMKLIEKDIQLLERHNHVFVGDANRTFYLA